MASAKAGTHGEPSRSFGSRRGSKVKRYGSFGFRRGSEGEPRKASALRGEPNGMEASGPASRLSSRQNLFDSREKVMRKVG
jgi:hypothetical protein